MAEYNCRKVPEGYRFAKFDALGNVEATYTVSNDWQQCDCPGSVRPICKHRTMLQAFLMSGAIDTGRFYNPDTGEWSPAIGEARAEIGVRRI